MDQAKEQESGLPDVGAEPWHDGGRQWMNRWYTLDNVVFGGKE